MGKAWFRGMEISERVVRARLTGDRRRSLVTKEFPCIGRELESLRKVA